MSDAWIAAVGVGVSVLVAGGSAAAVVFSAGQMKGRFDSLSEKLQEAMAEMRESRSDRQKTAAHEIRIGTLEKVVETLTRKVSTAQMKAVRAEARSRPDIGGHDD